MGFTIVAVRGVYSAGYRYSASIVGWRIHTGTIQGPALLLYVTLATYGRVCSSYSKAKVKQPRKDGFRCPPEQLPEVKHEFPEKRRVRPFQYVLKGR